MHPWEKLGVSEEKWNGWGTDIPHNLRWLSERHVVPGFVPCGMLPGEFLKSAADCIEHLAGEVERRSARGEG